VTDEVINAAPFVGLTKAQAQYALELESAVVRLQCVTRPEDLKQVSGEVTRRTALMGELPACGSVYDDVVQGRWPR